MKYLVRTTYIMKLEEELVEEDDCRTLEDYIRLKTDVSPLTISYLALSSCDVAAM